MKILYQGSPGAYSHLAALEVYPDAEIIPCKTFDDCFIKAQKDESLKIKYSIPIFPVIRFDSGTSILESLSEDVFKKHSSKVLHGTTSAFGSISSAAKCE